MAQTRNEPADAPRRGITSAVHLLTVRLEGVVPPERLEELRVWREEQLELTPDDRELATRFQNRIRQRFFAEYDRLLDESRERELLLNKPLAALVRRHLLDHADPLYQVLAYTIMPNHVHAVVQVADVIDAGGDNEPERRELALARVPLRTDEQSDYASPLVDFLQRLKRGTAEESVQLVGEASRLNWHGDSFDYWIRTRAELDAAVEYIAHNPVGAGLARSAEQWFFCSAHERFLHEGKVSGWLPPR